MAQPVVRKRGKLLRSHRTARHGPILYAELHCHTNYSLLDGASFPEDLVKRAKEVGLRALAITDHEGVYGIVRFALACKEQGVKPIFGAEVTLADESHLVLLAETGEGYCNLCRVLTHAHMRHEKDDPRVPFAVLAEHAGGLVALSACQHGELHRALLEGGEGAARAVAHRYRDAFGPRGYYVELHNHLLQVDGPRNAALARVAKDVGVGIVATNNVHYATKEHALLHHVVTSIRHRTTLDEAGDLLRANDEYYLKSPAQMARLFERYPEAIEATVEIADRCRFGLGDMKYSFPSPEVPEGETPFSWLVKCVELGRRKYYAEAGPEVDERLAHELSIVEKLDLAGYLLVFKDIVDFCRRERILVSIRGSAPASALLYCLGLCPIDPVEHNLVFERFASLERDELPDIDLDIAHEDRERVIQYVYGKYTRERAAMVAEVNTYRLKSAVRDVAKALGLPHDRAISLSKSVDERDLFAAPTPSDPASTSQALQPAANAFANTPLAPPVEGIQASLAVTPSRWQMTYDRQPPREAKGPRGWSETGEAALSGRDLTPDAPTVRPSPGTSASAASVRPNGAHAATTPAAGAAPSPLDGPATAATPARADRVPPVTGARHPRDATPYAARVALGVLPKPTAAPSTPIAHFGTLVKQLLNAPRHLSIHVGGFVISARPLSEVLPTEPARMPDRSIIPWDKDDLTILAEEFGVNLVKLDLLGLGMLSLVSRCFETIEQRTGERLDLHGFRYDPGVFDVICWADTVGLFQIESRAQMAFLPRLKPRNLKDVAISVGAIRPGPGAYQAGNHIANRRAGREKVDYLAPELVPVLKETMGVVLWQEQVMQVAMVMAGYTGGEADKLRRAMSSKRSIEHMEDASRDLVERIVARGHSRELAGEVQKMVQGFAGYGFPRAHAYPFAHLALISATLKLRHPAEFYAALLNCQPMGFYAPHTIVWDARRHGVRVLPVDVNRSEWECTVEDGALRLGLKQVDGIKEAARDVIERARGQREDEADAAPSRGHARGRSARTRAAGSFAETACAPQPQVWSLLPASPCVPLPTGPPAPRDLFASVSDFVARTGLRRDDLEALASVGAFLPFADRREALWQVGELAGVSGPRYLPGLAPILAESADLPAMTDWERTQADYEGLGLSLDRHVVEYYRPALKAWRAYTAAELDRLPKNLIMRVGGLVIIRQRPETAKDFTFLTLEDETGLINVVVQPKLYTRERALIRGEPLLVIEGLLQKDQGAINVIARRVWGLERDPAADQVPSRDFR